MPAGAPAGIRTASLTTRWRLARPKLRGTAEAFASRLFGRHVTKTKRPRTVTTSPDADSTETVSATA